MIPQNYKIAVIGAGKIAWSLCPALQKASFNITTIISRNIKSAKALAAKLKISNYSDNVSALPYETNLVILAVPDGQIEPVAASLAALNLNFKETLFIHLSGVMTVDSLKSLYQRPGMIASMHIMQTFPSRKKININGCSVSIEAEDYKTKEILMHIAGYLKLTPFLVTGAEKVLLHLSGVFCSNFMTGNFFAAENIVHQGNNTVQIMKNITEQTFQNILDAGPANALSGPIERGDYNSVVNHLKAIDNIRMRADSELMKNLKISYLAQSLVLLSAVEKKTGKLSANHDEIGRLIRDELKKLIA